MEQNTSLQQQLLDAGVHFGHLRRSGTQKCCLTSLQKRKAFIL
jgi:hypothetical protein